VDAAKLAESEPRLVEAIRDEILARGPMTFARFMERALTEPGLGYYATSDMRPTRAGDFLTAPELHPLFGRCVGRQLSEVWERSGAPAAFTVREYGSGRGTLERSVRDGLRADGSGLDRALRWDPIDLPGRAHGGPRAASSEPVVGCILANEFLDALPVHRLEVTADGLRERYVVWHDGWFGEVLGPPSSPELERMLAAEGVAPTDGQLVDVSPGWSRWAAEAARSLSRGTMIVIDYGHPAADLYGPRRRGGTLVTYRDHRASDDPFAAVGRADITAHVDLTAVERAVTAAGLEPLGTTSQAEFLVGLGLGEMLATMGNEPRTDLQDYLLARSSVARLLDPRHLGAHRVLVFGRGLAADPALRGLAFRVPRAGAAI
jgi:SAM-dependent MidA family methyltransferase